MCSVLFVFLLRFVQNTRNIFLRCVIKNPLTKCFYVLYNCFDFKCTQFLFELILNVYFYKKRAANETYNLLTEKQHQPKNRKT